jgi:superfamily II DNA/RNA helicase
MTTSSFGAALSFVSSEKACVNDQLEVFRWSLQPGSVEEFAKELGRGYVSDTQRLLNPTASLVPHLADLGHTARSGDLGEMVAAALYQTRLGKHIPFQKLQRKLQGNSTLQSADVLALTLTSPSSIEPVTVEVKARANPSPGKVLRELQASVENVDGDYLRAAWSAGVGIMQDHPDWRRHFAMSAAYHLARVEDSGRRMRPHMHHGVFVVGNDNLTKEKIEEYWNSQPPVSELHVIEVCDFADLRDAIFEAAAGLTYGDLADRAPTILGTRELLPGTAGLVSATEAERVAIAPVPRRMSTVVESALWYLADWDGLGLARANDGRKVTDPEVRGLSELLAGAPAAAVRTLGETGLHSFALTARSVMQLRAAPDELDKAVQGVIGDPAVEPEVGEAVKFVGAAIRHRLPRHPRSMVEAQGATGANVRHVVDRMTRVGRYALWPPQAEAVAGGLFDAQQPSLAIRMPTSAGKTALIELLAAYKLDERPQSAVAVLGPTKALVSQLTGTLRAALPENVSVTSSHGGLDYDIDGPSSTGLLAPGTVTVMTPERFDLEWRRAVTDDSAIDLDALELLVVDEAHLINVPRRGASLELSIARALRKGVRVVLLSSQFSDLGQISDWLRGEMIDSDWRPAWLDRNVYTRSEDNSQGWLCDESGECDHIFDLKPSERSKGDGVPRKAVWESAELVVRSADDGLVVVFTNQKRYINDLVSVVEARLGESSFTSEEQDSLDKLANSIQLAHAEVARLLRKGIGLHHGDLSRSARNAVETGARRRLLRCVVCTPTLLEGVDFPARSVIAAYPPENRGTPEIARMRNLAGRAGRGGLFTSGQFTVRTTDVTKAGKWLRAFQEQLPATTSALTLALRELMQSAQRLNKVNAVDETIDAMILFAHADGAASDGDLRGRLEAALGRTLWYSTTSPNERLRTFKNADVRASHVFKAIRDTDISRAFYRTGLPLRACILLRNALEPVIDNLERTVDSNDHDAHEKLLLRLSSEVAPLVGQPLNWEGLDATSLSDLLNLWLAGTPTADLEAHDSETWNKMVGQPLENLLPWVLTGIFEIAAAMKSRLDLRDRAHKRLGISRIRYGVPVEDVCVLVREGHDRVAVTQYAKEYEDRAPASMFYRFRADTYIRRRLEGQDPNEAGDALIDALEDVFF